MGLGVAGGVARVLVTELGGSVVEVVGSTVVGVSVVVVVLELVDVVAETVTVGPALASSEIGLEHATIEAAIASAIAYGRSLRMSVLLGRGYDEAHLIEVGRRPHHSRQALPGEGMRQKVEREAHSFPGSSMVARAWWDPEKKLLEVQFVDGTHWLYEGVSRETWRGFKSASSAGSYVHTNLNSHPNGAK